MSLLRYLLFSLLIFAGFVYAKYPTDQKVGKSRLVKKHIPVTYYSDCGICHPLSHETLTF